MTTDEKLDLVDEIWDDILKEKIKATDEQKLETERRLGKIDRGEMKFVSQEEFKLYLNEVRSRNEIKF